MSSVISSQGNVYPKGSIKVAKPDLYYGERSLLEDWILQIDLFFKFSGSLIAPKDRVTFATTYMRGRAQRWIKPYLVKYLNNQNKSRNQESDEEDEDEIKLTKWMENFTQFKIEIRRTFGISDEKETAIRILQYLRQKRSVAEYATIFQQNATTSKWNDDALMVMYQRGLRDNVKDELMRHPVEPKNLSELITITINLDDKLRHRALEKKYRFGPPMYGEAYDFLPRPRETYDRDDHDGPAN